MITATHYLIVGGILFSIGLIGLLTRRNLLLILLSIEIMLNATNLNFDVGANIHGNVNGHVVAFFVMVIAAAEVTIGLAIAVLLFRRQNSVDTSEITFLKG